MFAKLIALQKYAEDSVNTAAIAIALYWDPPKSANGILLQYQVIITHWMKAQILKYDC